MKISELQEILEHYKKENGDLEVRLVIDTPYEDNQCNLLDKEDIDTQTNFDLDEYDNLINNIGLTDEEAIKNLKERELAKVYLNIYTYIK